MSMKILQNQIDTHTFIDKKDSRGLNVVCFTKKKTFATNSYCLISLDNEEELKEIDKLPNKEMCIYANKFNKIKSEFCIDLSKDGIIEVDNKEKFNYGISDKKYPSVEKVIPKSKPTASARFNPKLLKVLIDYLNKQKCKVAEIELRDTKEEKPIVIRAKLPTGQNVILLLMVLRKL